MQLPLPLITNLVLIGGGHAHALVLRKWAKRPVAGARLTLINPGPTAPYTGMLPGFVAGHYRRDELDIDLVKLARFADARLVIGSATAIDRSAKTVTVPGRPAIPYDVCSIDVGISSSMPELDGFAEHGTAAKPLGAFASSWTDFVETYPGGSPKIVVLGGGVGGCELALAMHHRLSALGGSPTVTVVDSANALSGLGDRAQTAIRARLTGEGIDLLEHQRAAQVTTSQVYLESGQRLDADLVVGAAGARPHSWLSELGLQTEAGFITIDDTLRSVTDQSIFAVGDCAHMGYDPRPKAGVFAVRQAPVLLNNLQAAITGDKFDRYDPQQDYLKLISLGEKRAAADKFKRFMQGRGLWRLKDKIDRDFMTKFDDLPEMSATKPPKNAAEGLLTVLTEHPPLCGGCGAKVGADVLAGPLSKLPRSTRDDVLTLPGDDAALLDFGGVRQVITTDTVRSFTPDPYRMTKIAALHAMGDIWAMGAEPQAVLVTVTLPQLGPNLQREWLDEIMTAASEVLAPTGAEIVGGHTSMGAELSLGFSITGLLRGDPITLAGAQPGQKLIVTRALGSGVLFAAEMQKQARGRDVAALLDELAVSQGPAANLLAQAGATAMTDITGFGLAGHLTGMLRESAVAAELELASVPIFAGALELSRSGIRSHLHAANQAGVPLTSSGSSPREPLLFDPQTAGGMLAALPAAVAESTCAALVDAGYTAAIIGTVVDGEPRISIS